MLLEGCLLMSNEKFFFIVEGKFVDNECLKCESNNLWGIIEVDFKDDFIGGFMVDNF